MSDERETQAELLNELAALRRRVAELEASEAAHHDWQANQAAELLRESERRFRGIVENSIDGIVLTDERGVIIEWNQGQEQLTGIARHEAVGQFIWDAQFRLIPPARKTPELYEQIKATIQKFLAGDLVPARRIVERTLQRPDGEQRSVQNVMYPIRTPRGSMLTTAMRDVSDLKRAEAALRESELKYHTMFEASTDAIFLETMDGRVLDANTAACKMLGYTREEFLQLTVADLVPPETASTLPDMIAQEMTTGGIFVKAANKKKNGQVFPVEVSTQVALVEGQPRVIVYVRDITDRERATEALTRRMQELAALYETSLEINSQRELAKLLPAIVERAARLIGAPMGGLYLMRPTERGEILELVVSYNLLHDYTGALLHLGEGLSGRVAQTGETIAIENYHEWEGRAEVYADSPFRRVLGVPLKIENHVIGVINVTDTEHKGPYSEEEIRSVTLLANQAAIAIRNAQLYEASRAELAERKRAEQVQFALYRISEATHATKDLDALYRSIHAIIGELMPARNFYIALYDASANLLSFPYHADEYDTEWTPVKPGNSLTGYVLRSGEPLLRPSDVFEQLLAGGKIEILGTPPVDWLGVPLKVQQKIIGVMTVQTYSQADRLTLSDKDVLVFVSTQVAMAIERKQAEEALHTSASRFREIIEGSQDIIYRQNFSDGTLDYMSPSVFGVLGYTPEEMHSSTMTEQYQLFHPADLPSLLNFRDELEQADASGVKFIEREFRMISKSGEHRWIHGTYRLTRNSAGDPDFVLGTLKDITERKHAERDIQRLNHDLVRRARELTALNQAGRSMTSTLDLDALLSLILEQVKELLDVQAASVIMRAPALDEAGLAQDTPAELVFAAAIGPAADRLTGVRFSAADSIAGWVIRENKSALIADVPSDSRFHAAQHIGEITGMMTRSLLAAPLTTKGQVRGVIEAVNKTTDMFDEHDQAVLEALCSSAAIAVENARLLAETRHRAGQLALLYDAGLVLNRTLDPREQLEALSRIAMQALHADNGGFFRYDAAQEEIYYEFGVGRGIDWDVLRDLRVHVGEERGLIGWIAQNRTPFYLPDVTADPRWIVTDPEFRSAFWVPVQHENQLMGLLSVVSTRVNAFTPDDQRLLVLFANQVAVSLENARLYGVEQERATFLARALERQREVDRLQREFIQNVSHELRTPLALIRGHAEMLNSGWLGDLQPDQRGSVDVIVRRTQMLTKLVDNITGMLETEQSELVREPVNLAELVRAVLADFQATAENADLVLTAETEPDVPLVSGDRIALRRALDNLVGNGLKFTPAGGSVQLRLAKSAEGVVIEVADTGIGIPSDQLERIFERFYQVDGSATRRYGGMGLGLAQVKQIVEAHGGQITVTSEVGVGTTFTVWLPLA